MLCLKYPSSGTKSIFDFICAASWDRAICEIEEETAHKKDKPSTTNSTLNLLKLRCLHLSKKMLKTNR